MNQMDKIKLKCLIKMILIQKKGEKLTANQLANSINEHNWGFKIEITGKIISSFLKWALHERYSFLENIKSEYSKRGVLIYYYSSSANNN